MFKSMLCLALFGVLVLPVYSHGVNCSSFVERVETSYEKIEGSLGMLEIIGLNESTINTYKGPLFYRVGADPIFFDHLHNGLQLLILIGSSRQSQGAWIQLAGKYLEFMARVGQALPVGSERAELGHAYVRKLLFNVAQGEITHQSVRDAGQNLERVQNYMANRASENRVVDPWIKDLVEKGILDESPPVPLSRTIYLLGMLFVIRDFPHNLGLDAQAAQAKRDLDFQWLHEIPDFGNLISQKLQPFRRSGS